MVAVKKRYPGLHVVEGIQSVCLGPFKATEQFFLDMNSVSLSLHKFIKNFHLVHFFPRGYWSFKFHSKGGE